MNLNMALAGALGATLGVLAIVASGRSGPSDQPIANSTPTQVAGAAQETKQQGPTQSDPKKAVTSVETTPSPQVKPFSSPQRLRFLPRATSVEAELDLMPANEEDAANSKTTFELVKRFIFVTDENGQVTYDEAGQPLTMPAFDRFVEGFQRASKNGVGLLNHRIASGFMLVLNDVKAARYPNLQQRRVVAIADSFASRLAADVLEFQGVRQSQANSADTILVAVRSSQTPLKSSYGSVAELRADVTLRSNLNGQFAHIGTYSITPDLRFIRIHSEKFIWPFAEILALR